MKSSLQDIMKAYKKLLDNIEVDGFQIPFTGWQAEFHYPIFTYVESIREDENYDKTSFGKEVTIELKIVGNKIKIDLLNSVANATLNKIKSKINSTLTLDNFTMVTNGFVTSQLNRENNHKWTRTIIFNHILEEV